MSTTAHANVLAGRTDCDGRQLLLGDTVLVADRNDEDVARCGVLLDVQDHGLVVACGGDTHAVNGLGDRDVVLHEGLVVQVVLAHDEDLVARALRVLDATRSAR